MKDFVHLFQQLDQTTKTTVKVNALVCYFEQATDMDKLWTIAILSHRRPKRSVKTNLLRAWAAEVANTPIWLFEDSYHIVGDLAETMALIHPNQESKSDKSLSDWIEFLISLQELEEAEKKEKVLWAWNQLHQTERFIFNKLITGGWRMGVSQKLMTKALSQYTNIDENSLAHRLMGNWKPQETSFQKLVIQANGGENLSQPYPFYLAYPLEKEPIELGTPKDWLIERKWDGIRGQLIVREEELFIWSRGEELVTERFPELNELKDELPSGTVIDGEILAYEDGKPLNFSVLQSRIGRKTVSQSILKKAPVVLMAYDLLEHEGKDIRHEPLSIRRQILESLFQKVNSAKLLLSPSLHFNNWEEVAKEREESRKYLAEGFMLKQKNSIYQVGRKKGDWWKWKMDPLTIDAVLLYAMRGHGRRANLYSDYTFAVWKGNELVPFTKAYSGLTDEEIKKVDAFVKKNTLERFGPVRSVIPELVFEIAFEGIAKSTRHKSGVALRFPRMHRWRTDKKAKEANTHKDLLDLLELYM